MKVILFSDSHGNLSNMLDAVELERPALIIHLGDMVADGEKLHYACPGIPMEQVPGNCDGWFGGDLAQERLIEVEGQKLLLLHGHTAGVKTGLDRARTKGWTAGAAAVLFGHTHLPYTEQTDGLWLVNPGTARMGQYAVLTVDKNGFSCELKRLE